MPDVVSVLQTIFRSKQSHEKLVYLKRITQLYTIKSTYLHMASIRVTA